MYLHKTKNEHYTPPCCYFSGELEVVEGIRHNGRFELEFEGKTYSVPKNYKHVLSNMYGDYMKLPPKEKQVSHHHFTAYWK